MQHATRYGRTKNELHVPNVSEEKVLRKIFGCNKDVVNEQLMVLQNHDLHNLNRSPSTVMIAQSMRL
jgi:uncharacterized protein (UPF0216 family)